MFAARAAIASAGVALVALMVVHLLNISTRVKAPGVGASITVRLASAVPSGNRANCARRGLS